MTKCTVIYAHNHSNDSAATRSKKKVSQQTNDRLDQLFMEGHTPGSSRKSLQQSIHMNDSTLADRSLVPDYKYIYR